MATFQWITRRGLLWPRIVYLDPQYLSPPDYKVVSARELTKAEAEYSLNKLVELYPFELVEQSGEQVDKDVPTKPD